MSRPVPPAGSRTPRASGAPTGSQVTLGPLPELPRAFEPAVAPRSDSSPASESADLEARVRAILATIPDPEIPVLSIVELGIVHRVGATRERIRVELLPTFVGCPALEVIRASVAERLREIVPEGCEVRVEFTFETPWTSDRIGAEGRRKLARAGLAPPEIGPPETAPPETAPRERAPAGAGPRASDGPASAPVRPLLVELSRPVACPHCGSRRTVLDNPFGPTLCRAIHYCTSCRQPFEALKPV